MRIGIDAKCLSKRYTGIAIYVHEMIRFFNDIADKKDIFYLFSNHDFELDFQLKPNFHKVIYKSITGSMGIMFQMGKYINRYEIDVFWGTEHCIPLTNVKCKRIVTIHDLAVLKMPEVGTRYNAFLQKTFTVRACKRADLVIAISKATAMDVVSIAGIDDSKVKVIYNGDSPYTGMPSTLSKAEDLSIREKFKIDRPYFLYVGTIEPRKNIPTMIKAFNRFKTKHPNYLLVIAGGLGWRYKASLEEIENSQYKEDIIMTGYCSNKEKEFFYRNAEALLFTSLYEGLGLPLLEAMSVGTPVITSNVSSMPEVGGNLAYYINDVYDYNDLCAKMNEVSGSSEDERISLSEKSKEWAQHFSRKECAVKIYETFKQMCNE